jgi:hypothetical protein
MSISEAHAEVKDGLGSILQPGGIPKPWTRSITNH